MGRSIRGSNPGSGEFSAHVQTGNGANQPSYTVVPRHSPWRGVDTPPQSSAEVKERAELHMYTPSVPSQQAIGRTLMMGIDVSYFRHVLIDVYSSSANHCFTH